MPIALHLSSQPVHPADASLAWAGVEAVRLTGLLNKFATTLEACLVLSAFSFPVCECTDIWVSQCGPSVPATAQLQLDF